jgi:hypothetical protein
MDASLHASPPARPTARRFVPSARTLALLTLGIGIGALAALPLGGGGALPAFLAILAATGAAAVVLLRPSNPAAIAVADVLLGTAVIVTVFGDLGMLYVPLMLAFLAVTAFIERTPERAGSDSGLAWEPAPEFEQAMPLAVAAPAQPALGFDAPPPIQDDAPWAVRAIEVDAPTSQPPIEDETPAAVPALDDQWLPTAIPGGMGTVVVHIPEAPPREPTAPAGRHRAPSNLRRLAGATARAGRRLGARARDGVGNLRTVLVTEPTDVEPPDPALDPVDDDDVVAVPAAPRLDPELDELRHRFEERELDLVAAGKPWSALTHRAYGELRFLPATPPPRRPATPVVELDDAGFDDADWEPPSWKTMRDT